MKQLLSEFYDLIDLRISKAWSKTKKPFLISMAEGLQVICEKAIHIGSYAEEDTSEDQLDCTLIHYEWMREVKSFLVLWRDVIFQYQKGLILEREGEISESGLEYLLDLSEERVQAASTYIKTYFDEISKRLASDQEHSTYLQNQSPIANPWPIFQEQINTIVSQGHLLIDQYDKVLKTKDDFNKISRGTLHTISSFKAEIKRIKKMAIETTAIVKDHLTDDPQKIVKHVASVEEQLLAFNHHNTYTFNMEQIITDMVADVEVPVALIESQLQSKEINFAGATKNWLESEIQPLMMEAHEILESITNSMKMALVNIKNRIVLIDKDVKEVSPPIDSDNLLEPITSLVTTLDGELEELESYEGQVSSRISTHLSITDLYKGDRPFLDGSQQYIIGQLNLDQTAWIQKIKQWVLDKAVILKGFMANVANEESLSDSEKIVRYVKSRDVNESNTHYSNIFSAQGYIGESFWVGRTKELARMSQLITNWREGFRGSVILSGKRFCGKTVFGELIIQRYFPHRSVSITPGSTLKINGRTIEVEEDISIALDFIKKNVADEPYLIWIDDLELWQGTTVTSSQNVRTLLRYIDDLSAQLFFMVSMSNGFKHHYNRMHKMDKVFQAEINLDFMSEQEILQAIMIRHGATHRILVDDEGNKVQPQALTKMVYKLNRQARHNIGHALNLWSYFTYKVNDQEVIYSPELNLELPNFINDENSILFRAILMSKRTNEYRLRKSLGKAFKSKYQAIVQRLINLGIFKRHVDGLLEINEGVVNEVATYLNEARYIKYNR